MKISIKVTSDSGEGKGRVIECLQKELPKYLNVKTMTTDTTIQKDITILEVT